MVCGRSSSGRDPPCGEDPGKSHLALSTQGPQLICSNWHGLLEKEEVGMLFSVGPGDGIVTGLSGGLRW